MNVEIGAEDGLFPEKEYISGIFVALQGIPADDLLAAKLNSSSIEILLWLGCHAWQQPLIHQDDAELGWQGAQVQIQTAAPSPSLCLRIQQAATEWFRFRLFFRELAVHGQTPPARTSCLPSLLVVHLAAIPARVVENQGWSNSRTSHGGYSGYSAGKSGSG